MSSKASRNETSFKSYDDEELYYVSWNVEGKPKLINIYIHGGFAHAGDALTIAEELLKIGVDTYAFDLKGFGHWEGRSGHINHRKEYTQSILIFYEFLKQKYPDTEFMLSGHSMGGLLGTWILQRHQELFKCAVLSGIWLKTKANIPFILRMLAIPLNKIWPTFSDKPTFTVEELTHDEEMRKRFYEDIDNDLRMGKASVRWLKEMEVLQEKAIAGMNEITLPILVFQGGQDTIVDSQVAETGFNNISSKDKEWSFHPEFYHDVFNEVGREELLTKVSQFVSKFLIQ